MIQGIMDIRETDKKRPDRETIQVYVTKKTGVDAKEVHVVISLPMGSGCIFTKMTQGKESFFLVKDTLETVNGGNLEEENEEEGKDSFLGEIFLVLIDKLVNKNSNLRTNERTTNIYTE